MKQKIIFMNFVTVVMALAASDLYVVMSLTEAIHLALKTHPAIEVSNLRQQAQAKNMEIARSSYLQRLEAVT